MVPEPQNFWGSNKPITLLWKHAVVLMAGVRDCHEDDGLCNLARQGPKYSVPGPSRKISGVAAMNFSGVDGKMVHEQPYHRKEYYT